MVLRALIITSNAIVSNVADYHQKGELDGPIETIDQIHRMGIEIEIETRKKNNSNDWIVLCVLTYTNKMHQTSIITK